MKIMRHMDGRKNSGQEKPPGNVLVPLPVPTSGSDHNIWSMKIHFSLRKTGEASKVSFHLKLFFKYLQWSLPPEGKFHGCRE